MGWWWFNIKFRWTWDKMISLSYVGSALDNITFRVTYRTKQKIGNATKDKTNLSVCKIGMLFYMIITPHILFTVGHQTF